MKVNKLYLNNFRIHNEKLLEFDDYLNIIIGKNAVGKTTIAEAIYLLCLTKSHRTKNDLQLINHEKQFSRLQADIFVNNNKNRIEVQITNNSKKIILNNDYQNKMSDYIGFANVIMFSPEDLNLIKGSPKDRRRFLNIEIGQTSKSYLKTISKYKNILKLRNDYLKKMNIDNFDRNYLDVITEQLVDNAIKIVDIRTRYVNKINEVLKVIYSKLTKSKESIFIEYITKIKDLKEKTLKDYKDKYESDLLYGKTQFGPQNDDLIFHLNEQDAKVFASQGQQRTIALAVKLSLVEIIKEVKNEYPILILDDVFSELDNERQISLINYIDKRIQSFITTTEKLEIFKEINGTYKIINANEKE